MMEAIARTLESLKTNNFKADFAANSQIAKNKILQMMLWF